MDESAIITKAKEFTAAFLDEEFNLSVSQLVASGWNFVPIYESIVPLQAEWISNAIITVTKSSKVLAIDIEYKAEPRALEIEANRDNLLKFLFDSTGYVMFTNRGHDFLYYKDQLNRFSVICGSHEFLTLAYPSSIDTMKIMFEYYWLDDPTLSDQEKEYYKHIWKKFSNFNNCS
jgi:hypothetical protein